MKENTTGHQIPLVRPEEIKHNLIELCHNPTGHVNQGGYHLESLEHLFFSCPLIQSGYDWIQSMLFRASPTAPSISVCHALLGFSSDDLMSVPRVFAYVLKVCKFVVWCQQNNFRFRSERPSALCLLARLKQRLRFYLPLYFKRFKSSRRQHQRYFLRQWGANGVLGSIQACSFVPSF